MSSSAFTPSTTTVTNNVPVNVPVVEAWNEEALTWNQDPGLSTSGSYTAPRIKWRRVGSNMEGFYDFRNGGSTAANNVQVSFRLPNNLTIDSTKFIALPASIATVGFARKGSTYEYINYYPTGAGTPSKSIYITGGLNAQFAADYIGGGWFSVPIAEWAGSGTTTLATRAVEEYAYNTDTTNASNTSAFANGPDGVLFPNITATGTTVNKRVRFQSSILATDLIIVEYQQDGSGPWRNAAQRFPLLAQGSANVYGIEIINVSTTDVDIRFHPTGAIASGGTYGSPGELWSAYRSTGWKWRVRKVSSGAQVGYPVSARNIVGDTSGSVVPVGMLGQVVEVNLAANLIVNSTTESDASNLSLSLGAGTWLISYSLSANVSTNSTLNNLQGLLVRMTDSSNIQLGNSLRCAYCKNNASGGSNQDLIYTLHAQEVVTISSTQSYKVRARILGATGGGGVLYQDSTYGQSKFMAIRIA